MRAAAGRGVRGGGAAPLTPPSSGRGRAPGPAAPSGWERGAAGSQARAWGSGEQPEAGSWRFPTKLVRCGCPLRPASPAACYRHAWVWVRARKAPGRSLMPPGEAGDTRASPRAWASRL